MKEYVEKLVVTCNHCGKTEELYFSGGTNIGRFYEDLEDEGWEIKGERASCPDCELQDPPEAPFQKPVDELEVDTVMQEDKQGESYNINGFGEVRMTGLVFYPNEDLSILHYAEIERKSDGEKFWVLD